MQLAGGSVSAAGVPGTAPAAAGSCAAATPELPGRDRARILKGVVETVHPRGRLATSAHVFCHVLWGSSWVEAR